MRELIRKDQSVEYSVVTPVAVTTKQGGGGQDWFTYTYLSHGSAWVPTFYSLKMAWLTIIHLAGDPELYEGRSSVEQVSS